MNNTILLSICIPTYNRAEYLNQTIQSIVNSDGFSDEVEIIISDNCSTDNTEKTVKLWIDKYKNIKYFKQPKPTSIADQNFIDALSLGTGEYLKLNNDTVLFNKETIKHILDVIYTNLTTKEPLFFYNNYLGNKNITLDLSGPDIFLQKSTYFVTWIAHFGCWKIHFDNLSDKNKLINAKLMQVDWTFRIVNKHNKTIISFYNFYDSVILKNKNIGYNIFEVFSYNYLNILKFFVEKKEISKKTYQLEKKRLLFRFLIPNLVMYIYQYKTYKFHIDKPFFYLKEYRYDYFFYFSFLFFILYFILYFFIFIIKILTIFNPKLYNYLRKIKSNFRI